MWIGATYYDGYVPLPSAEQSWQDFGYHLFDLVYEGAYPTAKAWGIYWVFFILEAVMFVTWFPLSLPPNDETFIETSC